MRAWRGGYWAAPISELRGKLIELDGLWRDRALESIRDWLASCADPTGRLDIVEQPCCSVRRAHAGPTTRPACDAPQFVRLVAAEAVAAVARAPGLVHRRLIELFDSARARAEPLPSGLASFMGDVGMTDGDPAMNRQIIRFVIVTSPLRGPDRRSILAMNG